MSPRRAANVRWLFTAATLILAAVWLGSAFIRVCWCVQPYDDYEISTGRLTHGEWGHPRPIDTLMKPGVFIERMPRPLMRWRYDPANFNFGSVDLVETSYPLWPAIAALLIPTTILWLLHLRSARRTDLCPTCHYPRTGLAPSSPCPECGTRPTPESAP